MDIAALNMSQPYSNKTYTPFEEMYGLTSPVNGIPMTETAVKELVERKYMSDKIQRAEYRNSNHSAMRTDTNKLKKTTNYPKTG